MDKKGDYMQLYLCLKKKDSLNKFILLILSFLPSFTLINASNNRFMKLVLLVEFILLLIMVVNNYKLFSQKEIIIAMINIISIMITLSFHSAYGNALMFINLLLCCKLFNNISIEKNLYFQIHLINGTLLSMYVFMIDRPLYSGNRIPDAFNNYINTNMISILYLCAFLHFTCCITCIFKRKKNCLFVIFLFGLFYGENIWFYQARSAMISLFVFVVLIILLKQSISYKIYKRICVIALFIALLFPFIYIIMINFLNFTSFLGKGISTRAIVWGEALEIINKYPVFGSGNDILIVMNSRGALTTSMHNNLLSIWKILGIIPTITFISCCVQHDNNKFDNKKNLCAQIAFISTLPLCFFESFYTEELLYMAFLPFLITNVKEELLNERR